MLGRERELSTLERFLGEGSVLLVGPRRMGKTELLKHLVREPPAGIKGVRVDLEGLEDVEGAVARIGEELGRAGLGPAWAKAKDQMRRIKLGELEVVFDKLSSWERLEALVQAAIGGLPEAHRLVLMLDEVPWWLDELRQHEDGDRRARRALARLRHLRQRDDLAERFRMILTGSVALAGLARELDAAAEINDLSMLDLGPLEQEFGHALLEAELVGRTFTNEAGQVAHAMAGGSPHWIKQIAAKIGTGDEAVEEGHVEQAVATLLSPRMRHLFHDEWRTHLNKRHGADQARILRHVLRAAAVADEGVELAALITAALDASLPDREQAMSAVHDLIDEFYLEVRGDRYRFMNPIFRRWCERYGDP